MRLTTEQQARVEVKPKTQGGHDAPIDGEVTFESSDPLVAEITVTGPASATIRAIDPGAAQITASFDADLGEGVRRIELSGAIEVVNAEAVTGELVFGEPEQQ